MKVIGLAAEYNPFHNGHLYHLAEAKKRSHADAVIVVMSGDFVQRGEPALFSKRIRAKMALECGADLVLELPVCFATSSAEYFAYGAAALLDRLNCVDEIWFGSERGEIAPLEAAADILTGQPETIRKCVRPFLENGSSYPAAREAALRRLMPDAPFLADLPQPNNLLGIEYLKALKHLNSAIKPCTLQRAGTAHHSPDASRMYCSASTIRKGFLDGLDPSSFTPQLPKACVRILEDAWEKQGPVYPDDLSLLLKYKLLKESPETLKSYQDVGLGLACKISKRKNECSSFSGFCMQLKSKDLTYTHISRALLHIVLGLSGTDFRKAVDSGDIPYARVLGFRTDSTKKGLFSLLKKNSRIPLITRLAQASALRETGKQMLDADILASDLYQSILADKFHTPFRCERQQTILKWEPPLLFTGDLE